MIKLRFFIFLCFFAVFIEVYSTGEALAQTPGGPTSGVLGAEPEKAELPPLSEEEKAARRQPFRYSLFFSAEDLMQIRRAQEGKSVISGKNSGDKIPQVRKIRLAGIVYFSPDQWMVWLNGLKVTPWVLPEEVSKIEVHPGWIYLEWFDIGANHIISLEMPANSEYDIVTGVLIADPTPTVVKVKR